MGSLRNKVIKQTRIWLDDSYNSPLPNFDYDFTYPITVYDAVKKTTDDNASTLTDELAAIYRLISEKQNMIAGGDPGQLMAWSGVPGTIATVNLVRNIAATPLDRSNNKVPTERAVGMALDSKTPILDFNLHRDNTTIHISDVERNRWNSMAPMSSLSAHIANTTMHITSAERTRWNAKADATDVDAHIYNLNNPHNVSAHQVNTYTRSEIDDMIQAIHESFFNYLNIEYNIQTDEGELVQYDSSNWNPNYVLGYSDELPDISDIENTYFALKPVTDYTTNETSDCLIYLKTPGVAWREIGTASMNTGDMVITYPDTVMYVWVSGRFVSLFSGSGGVSSDDEGLWYPTVSSDGTLSWGLSYSSSIPAPVNIKGEPGYTPIKGVDYFDGTNGIGIPAGGDVNELIVKLTTDNYNTTWKSLSDILSDWALAGNVLPEGIVSWSSILNRPNWYQEFGNNIDGFISQKVITDRFEALDSDLAEFTTDLNELKEAKDDFYEHQLNWDNPHHTTPEKIGAVSLGDFTAHTSDFNNPHNVTKVQLGLGNVDNTSDLNKPISTAVQTAIDGIYDAISTLDTSLANGNFIKAITWDNNTLSLILTFRDNTTMSVPVPIANLQVTFDSSTNELVFTQPDNTEVRVDVSALIPVYSGSDSDNIHVVIENDNAIKATIIPGTVGQYEIAPSVNLRNSPTTTTQVVSDRSTKIATTEFVASQTINNLISYDIDRPLSANMGRILNQEKVDLSTVQQMINDISVADVIDNLDSTNQEAALSANMGRYLNLTKAPRVHTSPNGATFGIATISLFGHTRASEVDPEMDGTVFRGTDNGRYARADHRHPTDITRASASDLTDHINTPIASENGAHELRFYNNSLDYKDENGNWLSVFGYLRKANTAYIKGDVIQDLNLPKWAELECVISGTTGSGSLMVPSSTIGSYTGVCIGDYIVDGTVKWVVRAKRTQFLLDVPTPFKGSFETITLDANVSYEVPVHPELGVPMIDCRFCDGNNGTIDMRDRFIMGKTQITDLDASGGSDTVTLTQAMLPKVEYTIDISGLTGSTNEKGSHNHSVSQLTTSGHSHNVSGSTHNNVLTASGSDSFYLPLFSKANSSNYYSDIYSMEPVNGAAGQIAIDKNIYGFASTLISENSKLIKAQSLSNLTVNATTSSKYTLSGINADISIPRSGWGSDGHDITGSLDLDIYGTVLEKYAVRTSLNGGSTYSNFINEGGTDRLPIDGYEHYIFRGPTNAIGSNIAKTTITTSGTAASTTDTIAAFNTQNGGAHTHTVTIGTNQKAKVKIGNTEYNTLQLNVASSQSNFSVVSKHYKLAYIQRIY